MSKRLDRKITVRDWLLLNGPATMPKMAKGTGLSPAAVSRAVADIRNDPSMEFVTVPTQADGYAFRIAYTVEEALNGILNQTKHLLTRAESMVTAGEKMTALAVTPDEYALAADLKANGKMLASQAQNILTAIGR